MEPSKISKIGPLWKIEGGDIFLHPFKSYPLNEFNPDLSLKADTPLLLQVKEWANNWYDKFPDCCSTHQKFKSLPKFSKKNYSFIPGQIINNLQYFAHCLEYYFGEDNWFEEVTEYLDYLNKSFGTPEVGGYIFESALRLLIENIKLDNKEITDDDKLLLLEFLEPHQPEYDIKERDLVLLYQTFQKWLEAMPDFGMFTVYKEKLTGKVPMNIFACEVKFNKYLRETYMRMRSRKELLDFLRELTDKHLKEINILIQNREITVIEDKEGLIEAAEKRLKLGHAMLFKSDHTKEEFEYLGLIEQWLNKLIEYYGTVNQYTIREINEIKNNIQEIRTNTTDVLSNTDLIRLEISSLVSTRKPNKWIDTNLIEKIIPEIDNEVENDRTSYEEMEDILKDLKKYFEKISSKHIDTNKINKRLRSGDVSIKHKLKFSIPLFLFTRYEVELEVSDKQKLPKTLKEVKELLIST